MSFSAANVGGPPKILSVTELAWRIRRTIEEAIAPMWVEGEISNWRVYAGHAYFTLKDEQSAIRAVLFRDKAEALAFEPQDGLKVLVWARVSLYAKRGDIELVALSMEPREKGALWLAFEQLKAKLAAEGLFESSRKKRLPPYPATVGLVTSLEGAAVRDMLSVLRRRWEGLRVLVYPVRVQGDGAPEDIVRALRDFNRDFPETDLLLVGRGGGSWEDLQAFNTEPVARAIAASRIPVVSCVGHETDTTIADFVADVRAPTPSAAAELAVPEKRALLEGLRDIEGRMRQAVERRLSELETRLSHLSGRAFWKRPERLFENALRRLAEIEEELERAIEERLSAAERALALSAQKLHAFSPLQVLSRGYAIAEKMPERKILTDARQARPGDTIRLILRQGRLSCEVIEHE
jgi:exodeoxyribonuclease VII large subunit